MPRSGGLVRIALVGLLPLLIVAVYECARTRVGRAAGVLYAAPAAVGGDCTSWEDACSLQAALVAAGPGDEIWVQAGVHTPGTNRTDTFALRAGVALYGGFAGTETARHQRDWAGNLTILSGDIGNDDVTDASGVVTDTADIVGENSYHVVSGSGVTETAVLDGFIVTAGQAYGETGYDLGGGMHTSGGGMFNGDGSHPTLTNVTFIGNAADYGGGMRNYYDSGPVMIHVTFRGNAAAWGAGLQNEYRCSPTLTDVVFRDNSANDGGGGIYNRDGSSPFLVNVLFTGNTVTDGGAVYNGSSHPTLVNVTMAMAGNEATSAGGGMYNLSSNPAITNTLVWGNRAVLWPQMYNSSGVPTISHSDIQGCGGSDSWDSVCGIDEGGNIDADPGFVDPEDGDLRLAPESPAIDAGDNSAVPAWVTTDVDGNPRFVDGDGDESADVDMGAYEFNLAEVTVLKAVTPAVVAPGEMITFTLTLDGSGSIPATQVVLTDMLSTFLSVSSVVSEGIVITDTGYSPAHVWDVEDVDPGQGGVITLMGSLTSPVAAGVYTNTAVIAFATDFGMCTRHSSVTYPVSNTAPTFTSAPLTLAGQDDLYGYDIAAADLNGDTLAISATVLAGWLTLADYGDGTALLSGTPSNADVGDHEVVLEVTDSGGLSDTQVVHRHGSQRERPAGFH